MTATGTTTGRRLALLTLRVEDCLVRIELARDRIEVLAGERAGVGPSPLGDKLNRLLDELGLINEGARYAPVFSDVTGRLHLSPFVLHDLPSLSAHRLVSLRLPRLRPQDPCRRERGAQSGERTFRLRSERAPHEGG